MFKIFNDSNSISKLYNLYKKMKLYELLNEKYNQNIR